MALWQDIIPVVEQVYAQSLLDIAARLSDLSVNGDFRRFVVCRMGSTGSTWLAKLLNSHPDVFCSHEAVVSQVYPATQYDGDDVLKFIERLAGETKHYAYRAVGDVGSVWLGHLEHMPTFTKALLLRHPARTLRTRLAVFPDDRSFSAIAPETRTCIRKIWGIDLDDHEPIDQVFLLDVFTFATQFWALDNADLVIRIEDMRDVAYCRQTLKALTGLEYSLAHVEDAVQLRVNRRSGPSAPISEIVAGFTERQREWYRRMLGEIVPHFGYGLMEEAQDPASGLQPA